MTKREFFNEFQKLAWKCYKRELPGVDDAHISVYGRNGEPGAPFFAYTIAATDKVAAKVGKKYLHETISEYDWLSKGKNAAITQNAYERVCAFIKQCADAADESAEDD